MFLLFMIFLFLVISFLVRLLVRSPKVIRRQAKLTADFLGTDLISKQKQ